MAEYDLEQTNGNGRPSHGRAASETGVQGGNLRLYRLIPVAADNDPNWLGIEVHEEVTVCALSAADARVVAAARELDYLEIDAAPAEDATTVNASMYRNERLYTAVDAGVAAPDMKRGVIDGVVRVDNITPSRSD